MHTINNKVLFYRTGSYNQYPVISHDREEYEGRAEPQTGDTTREGAEAQNHGDHENSGSWSLTEMLKKAVHLTQGMGCRGPAPADPGYSKERRPRRLFIC